MEDNIKSYEEFYPYYLKEHSNRMCRLLHVIGTTIVLALVLTSIIHLNPYWLLFVPITGFPQAIASISGMQKPSWRLLVT